MMSEALWRAIVESGETYLGLCKATGVTRASIHRLAAHFDLSLLKTRGPQRRKSDP